MSVPASAATSSAKATSAVAWPTRALLYAPWPSPVSFWSAGAESLPPFDLRWFATTSTSSLAASSPSVIPPAGWNTWASGSRAFENAGSSIRTTESPTGSASATW